MANSNGWGDGSVNNNIGWGQGANNSTGWGKSHLNSWSGATDIDGGNPPVNSVAPALSGTAQEGQTLTCSTGTWSGSPTYTYQWKRDGNNITSATNSTYTLVTADVGTSIKCTVTATNFVGSATADSNTVVPTSSVDADAQAFITAASITDPTQQSAINQLVVDLKGYNIWSKMQAIYPMVGGTSTTMKWNLKDPRDLNVAFRLQFIGGGSWDNNGYTPNGTNGYADSFYNPNTNLASVNSAHLSYYSRTNATGGIEMGGGPVPLIDLTLNYGGAGGSNCWNMASYVTHFNLDSRCFMINSRTASNSFKVIKNGSVLVSSTGAAGATKPNANLYLGKRNYDNLWSNKQCAFASIGDGLTDTEAANFYTAVQAFQTTLGRQV